MRKLRTLIRIAIALTALVVIAAAMPLSSGAATREAVAMKATDCSDSMCSDRFQFRISAPVKEGDQITFYIKAYSTIQKIRVRTDTTDFGYASVDDGDVSKSLGDGWYAVRGLVETGDSSFSEDVWGVTVYISGGCSEGDTIYIRDLKVGSRSYSASELAGITGEYYARPVMSVSVQSLTVADAAVSYDWSSSGSTTPSQPSDPSPITPSQPGANYNAEYAPTFTGTLPSYDMTPYTWKVNTDKGGKTDLPGLVLAATGQYVNVTNVNDQLVSALKTTSFKDANNMIFLVSDGFGPNQLMLAENFTTNIIMNDMTFRSESRTNSYKESGSTSSTTTTDSAAGGTALSCGIKTRYSYQALDQNMNPVDCISEVLRAKFGKIIGVVSTGWAYDSTPAVFGGGHSTRSDNNTNITGMLSFAPDLFMGNCVKDGMSIYNNLKNTVLAGQKIGYYTDWSAAMKDTASDKMWISFADDVKYNDSFSTSHPTISQMMAYSLAFLQKRSLAKGDVGFFLMFENGMTDMAGHAEHTDKSAERNDAKLRAKRVIGETRASSEMTAIALKFACENPDTIVIHTADHETGGCTLGSGWQTNIGAVKFSTTGHSSQNVEVFAIGKGTQVFQDQVLENCQVGKLAAYLMGIDPKTYGAPEEKWAVDDIIAGAQQYIEPDYDAEDRITGKSLHVRINEGGQHMTVTVKGAGCKAHGMVEFALKVPAGAVSMDVYGDSMDAGHNLLSQNLDKFMNYVPVHDQYQVTVKPDGDFNDLIIVLNGTFNAGDEMIVDSIQRPSGLIDFESADISIAEFEKDVVKAGITSADILETIAFDRYSVSGSIGQRETVNVQFVSGKAAGVSVKWTTDNEAVATVTGNKTSATVIFRGTGTATITATLSNGVSETLTVTVIEGAVVPGDFDGDGRCTDDDAIYLLFSTFFEKEYPLNQPADFDGDERVTDGDAIYLLFHVFYPEVYPIKKPPEELL